MFKDVTTSERYQRSLRQLEGKGRDKSKASAYRGKSGTVKDKRGFCLKAIKHLTDFDQLSSDAQKVTVKLALFIKEKNHK